MLILDYPAILLISLNIIQMVSIMLLLLPLIDIITISKYIKRFREILQDSPLIRTLAAIYAVIIVAYGILGPTRTLNKLKLPKYVREGETPEQKLLRVIDSTNAIRNYFLAGFSLFYVLVIWRLFDFVIFSAKLHEFSDLMGNYDLIDITYITEAEDEDRESTFSIDETLDEDVNSVHWPSIAQLNKTEQTRIQIFFKDTPKKADVPDDHDASTELNSKNTSKNKQPSSSKTSVGDTIQEQSKREQSTSTKGPHSQISEQTEENKEESKSQDPSDTQEDKSSK